MRASAVAVAVVVAVGVMVVVVRAAIITTSTTTKKTGSASSGGGVCVCVCAASIIIIIIMTHDDDQLLHGVGGGGNNNNMGADRECDDVRFLYGLKKAMIRREGRGDLHAAGCVHTRNDIASSGFMFRFEDDEYGSVDEEEHCAEEMTMLRELSLVVVRARGDSDMTMNSRLIIKSIGKKKHNTDHSSSSNHHDHNEQLEEEVFEMCVNGVTRNDFVKVVVNNVHVPCNVYWAEWSESINVRHLYLRVEAKAPEYSWLGVQVNALWFEAADITTTSATTTTATG